MPRTDNVQIRIDFITDESKQFANVIKDTEKFRGELKKAQKEVETLTKEQDRLAAQGKDTTAVSLKLAEAERKVAQNLQNIAESSRDIAKIDLSKLMPSQLVTRATQLKQALQFIPAAHPERKQMEADLKRINDQLAEMNGKTKGVSKEMAGLRGATGGLSGIFQSIIGNFLGGGILGIVQSVIGGIWSLGKTALQASADMEGLKVAVEVFLGSGAAATKFLKDIQKFAAETPFEFPELAEAGKKLLAFGYSGDEAMKLLKKLGDVASATQVPIGELAAIIGKAKLGQKIQGEELNQLADRGINVFPQLAKVLKTTEDQIKKLGSEGKISYADLEQAITMATEKGGQFNGMMAKQSKTFSGLMSTMQDNFNQFVQTIFGGIGEGLKPAIAGIADFFGQLTDLFRDGKKPVGEFAEVIQYAATIFKILGNVFGIVWEVGKLFLGYILEQIKAIAWLGNRVGDLIGWFVGLAEEMKKIPALSLLFKGLLDTIGLVSDLLSNASATFAGFRAAAQQAITNVQNYMLALAIDAEIMGAKLLSALSLGNKDSISETIKALEGKKAAMFNAGRTVEQAYTEGRNTWIKAQNQVEKEGEAKKQAAKEEKKGIDEKAAAKAEKERLDRIKAALEMELELKEIAYRKEALVNEIAFLNKEKNESAFNKKLLELERDKYDAQIKIFDTYQASFSAKSDEYRNIELKKLEAQKKLLEVNIQLKPRHVEEVATLSIKPLTTKEVKSDDLTKDATLTNIQTNADIEKQLVKQKFADLLSLELNFELKRLEIQKKAFADQRIEIERLYHDKIITANEYAEKMIALGEKEIKNDEKIQKSKEQISQVENDRNKMIQGFRAEAIDIAVDLMQSNLSKEKQAYKEKSDNVQTKMDLLKKAGKEESAEYKKLQQEKEAIDKDEIAARKKAGATIKAFQIAQIVMDGIAEVQGIWKTANLNALNILFPGAGEIIAGVKTAIAIGRSTSAISRVKAQQFEAGGVAALKSGIFGGKPHSTGGTKGFFSDGTAVEVEKDEAFVVVNKKNTPLLGALSSINAAGGNGKSFFGEQGFAMNINTTPRFSTGVIPPPYNNQGEGKIIEKMEAYMQKVDSWATSLEVSLPMNKLERKQKEITLDRNEASY
jgi:tape measure domain-containing protein